MQVILATKSSFNQIFTSVSTN